MAPSVSRQLRRDVDEAFERYRNTERVSARERIKKLQRVIRQAEHLRRTLAALDSRTRQAIVAPAARSRYTVDPLILVPQLKMLRLQAEHARRYAAAPRRGPRRKDALRQLIADLGIIWQLYHPGAKDIVAGADGGRRGPMLDFVDGELRREHVGFRSKQALGKTLYAMRPLIRERAEAARARKLVTRKDDLGGTVVSLETASARRRRSS